MGDRRWSKISESLVSEISERRKGLTLLTVMLLLACGVVGARIAGPSTGWVSAVLIILALGISALLLTEYFEDSHRSIAVGSPPTVAARTIGAQLVIAVSIERRRLICGAVALLSGAPDDPVGMVRPEPIGEPLTYTWTRPNAVPELIANAIAATAGELGGRAVDGIGLALPGLVDISHGVLQESPGGLTPGPIAAEIARLFGGGPQRGGAHAFGFDMGSEISIIEKVASNIHIDNDSRCIGRFLLNSYPAEKDFASIYVGKGVGSAIVLDGRLYFGAHGSAGECGHQVVDLDGDIILPGLERELKTPMCACGKDGIHYETLVNDSGVLRLAASIDPELFSSLSTVLAKPSPSDLRSAPLLEITKAIFVDEEDEDIGPMTELVKRLAESGRLYQFATILRDRYAQLLTLGVANTVNTLDLSSVYMCGPLIESFNQLPGFREELEYWRKKYVFREGHVGIRIEHDTAYQAWIGAALMFRDPAYADAADVQHSVRGRRGWSIPAGPDGATPW